MIVASPKRIGEIARKAFDILAAAGKGLPVDAILREIEAGLPLSQWERTKDVYHGMKPFEEMAHAGAIPLVKAGWMTDDKGVWTPTGEGLTAHAKFARPEDFIGKAASRSLKGWLIIYMPRMFGLLSRIKTQYDIERQMVRQVGLGLLLSRFFGRTPAWQRRLPLQAPRRFSLPEVDLRSYEDLVDYLDSVEAPYHCAGHTLYLPPKSASQSVFASIMSQYPPDAGLKITKNMGGANGAYVFGGVRNRKISIMYNRMTYDRARLVLVANLLYSKELSSRLYDLVEITCGRHLWTAYIVRHLNGPLPTESECRDGISRIKQLEEQGLLKVTLSQGYDDEDFSCPDCNNNAFMDEGKFCYIDFQSFLLMNYDRYLAEAKTAADAALARREAVSMGSPAGRSTARRFTTERWEGASSPAWVEDRAFSKIQRSLRQARVCVKDRVVLELGCGDGASIAGYLKQGAAWCHGWDLAEVTGPTERLLLALGCTRFSLSQADPHWRLIEQLPEFLMPMLQDCIVSIPSRYPVTEELVGQLQKIPWKHIIYRNEAGEVGDTGGERFERFRFEMEANLRLRAETEFNDDEVGGVWILERTADCIAAKDSKQDPGGRSGLPSYQLSEVDVA